MFWIFFFRRNLLLSLTWENFNWTPQLLRIEFYSMWMEGTFKAIKVYCKPFPFFACWIQRVAKCTLETVEEQEKHLMLAFHTYVASHFKLASILYQISIYRVIYIVVPFTFHEARMICNWSKIEIFGWPLNEATLNLVEKRALLKMLRVVED